MDSVWIIRIKTKGEKKRGAAGQRTQIEYKISEYQGKNAVRDNER